MPLRMNGGNCVPKIKTVVRSVRLVCLRWVVAELACPSATLMSEKDGTKAWTLLGSPLYCHLGRRPSTLVVCAIEFCFVNGLEVH